MKKLVFILTILLGAGLLIFISFGGSEITKKDTPSPIDFSEGRKLYAWNSSEKTFSEMNSTGTISKTKALFFERFSPVDGIYYSSEASTPLKVSKNETGNMVIFGSGLFVCNIQTGLERYDFRFGDLNLHPKGRGVFMIDTRGTEIKVFSFDTFLDIELTDEIKRSTMTSFVLFPSLLFTHNPKNTQNLKSADILRVSLIDSIRYMDLNAANNRKILLAGDEDVFLDIQKDINNRFRAFKEMYTTIAEKKTLTKIKGTNFFDISSPLFINDSKKIIFLKNTLISDIIPFFSNPKTTSEIPIKKTLADMKELDLRVYNEGLAILKQYYYILRFAHFNNQSEDSDFLSPESPLTRLTEENIAKITSQKQGEYYLHLSDLFAVHYFSSLDEEKLNEHLETILQKILDNKILAQEEFLPFVFFTTQYLSSGPTIPNEDTMRIIDHLFQITNEYYAKNKINNAKMETITSTIFYNYTKIFSRLYGVFVSTFTDKTAQGLLLKSDYLSGGKKELTNDFTDTFKKVINNAKKDTENKRKDFYSSRSLQTDSQTVDSYSLLQSTLKPFDTFIAMFDNYPKYLNDSHLNDSNKGAQGILIDTMNEMSLQVLQDYLKNFNNLDITSLKIINDFRKDGFYEVQVTILGNTFHFKLWEQGHMIGDISSVDAFGQKKIFPNITISLDQKEKQLKDSYASTNDQELQYKYDFKNFFETTFLKADTGIGSIQSQDTDVKGDADMDSSPEIQLFIQRELLDKDFKNIASFIPIEFKNITASIDSTGEYVIDIKNINKVFTGKNGNYTVEINGKYLFKRHTFSRLSFKVKNDSDKQAYDFEGTAIEILPARISLLTVPDILKDIGSYIDVLRSSYTNQKSIILDLNGKKAILDNVGFPVTIENE